MTLKKIIFFISLLTTLGWTTNAQTGYSSDDRPIHFGFSLGFNTMDFATESSLVAVDGTVYNVDVSNLKPGFSVGIISDMLVNRYFNLRFTPTLHFGERELSYAPEGGGSTTSITVPSVPITFPLYIKYSAERYQNVRPYLIGGGGISFDLGTNKEKPVYLRTFDAFAEVGVGCDIYLGFFKLAPELKFSIGSQNLFIPLDERDAGMLSEADKMYSIALSKLKSRMLTLTFNFE